jgi:DNA-binding IclR family transcriptional regulator
MSTEATNLVFSRIGSVEKLEVFVAVARAQEQTTIIELVTGTRLPASIVRHVLRELETAKLVETTSRGTVRLIARDARERAAVAEVVEGFSKFRGMLERTPTGS